MNKLKIEWSYDEYDCEACGNSYSYGAVVKFDNKIILNQPARAHCFSSGDIEYEDILIALCKHLNIEVEENN